VSCEDPLPHCNFSGKPAVSSLFTCSAPLISVLNRKICLKRRTTSFFNEILFDERTCFSRLRRQTPGRVCVQFFVCPFPANPPSCCPPLVRFWCGSDVFFRPLPRRKISTPHSFSRVHTQPRLNLRSFPILSRTSPVSYKSLILDQKPLKTQPPPRPCIRRSRQEEEFSPPRSLPLGEAFYEPVTVPSLTPPSFNSPWLLPLSSLPHPPP